MNKPDITHKSTSLHNHLNITKGNIIVLLLLNKLIKSVVGARISKRGFWTPFVVNRP